MPRNVIGYGKRGKVGEQESGEPCDHARQHIGRQLNPKYRITKGVDPTRVDMSGLQHHAKRRRPKPIQEYGEGQQQCPGCPIHFNATAEFEETKIARFVNIQPIITTKNSQADHQEIKHLRKSQRDHDEAYARGSQTHRTDKHGHHNADRYTNRKLNPAVRDAVMTEYADGIAAQANKHGVPETYQTGKAK